MTDEIRDKLRLPIAAAITLLWMAAGAASIVTDDVQVFVIASGPFTIVVSYLFTDGLLRRARNGKDDG